MTAADNNQTLGCPADSAGGNILLLTSARFLSPGDAFYAAVSPGRFAAAIGAHTHADFHEIFWIRHGWGWHWRNGRREQLEPGSVRLIRGEDVHRFEMDPARPPLEILNIAFPVHRWQELRTRYGESWPDLFAGDAEVWLPKPQAGGAWDAWQRLAEELVDAPPTAWTLDLFLLATARLATPSLALSVATGGSNLPDWLAHACRQIQEPAQLKAGVTAFHHLAGRCPEHVIRATRRHLGKSPTEIVNEARLRHAAALLTRGKEIAAACHACGFVSLSHFYRLFRLRYGAPPREYQLRQRQIFFPE